MPVYQALIVRAGSPSADVLFIRYFKNTEPAHRESILASSAARWLFCLLTPPDHMLYLNRKLIMEPAL